MECQIAFDGNFSLAILTGTWHAPVLCRQGEMLILRPIDGWEVCTIEHLVSVIEKVARKRADEVGGHTQDRNE